MGVRYNSAMESSAWKYHSDTGLIESPTGVKLGDGYSGNGSGAYAYVSWAACHLNHAQTVK
jgi:hypothetical protein